MTLVLGLDIGSTTTKAALVDVTDAVTVVRVARRPTPTSVNELIETAAAVSRECLAATGAPVAAVGIASMAESGAALDGEGRPLTTLLRWNRPVDRAHLATLLTAHPSLPVDTGVPPTTKPAAVTLIALRDEDPEIHNSMRHWAGVADLVAHALTGVRATDHTLAARTMLAGRGDAWNTEIVENLGLREHMLPALRAPGERVGHTSAEATTFGLGPGTPVYVAGHDHTVGAWAAGARGPGDAADSLGTSEAIVRITDAVDIARAVAEGYSVGSTVDGRGTTILGGSPACGALLAEWDTEHPADHLTQRLAALTPESWSASSMIVLPYPSGRQCPAPQPHAWLQVFGTGDAEERTRGVLQSLVAHARWMRETADALAGSPTASLTLIGSLALHVPVWAPLAAASVPSAFRCTTGEPVAAGAALLAGVREGIASPDASILPRGTVRPLHTPDGDGDHRRFLAAVTSQLVTTHVTSQGEP
ncbi:MULTISPECIES: FGGY family carbohydrate kinase [unclassified Microbacterium]|uniref:FGGY family carbohydrate kinase n=1 Tax=unclassified Microbacterium TaxID=2609290 RepID=UPI00160445AC|nr:MULTISPECIES: FGGY family carbohydrate kinase [unclassified Microbacterium]MBT2483809.1 hypothetical protein [Microbacterium sp. ISL-108]